MTKESLFLLASQEAAEDSVHDAQIQTGRAMRRRSNEDLIQLLGDAEMKVRLQLPQSLSLRPNRSCVYRIPHYGDQRAWSGYRARPSNTAMRSLKDGWRKVFPWAIPPYLEEDDPVLELWR